MEPKRPEVTLLSESSGKQKKAVPTVNMVAICVWRYG